jgi:heme A synthase
MEQFHNILSTAISLFTLAVTLLALFRLLRREGLGSDFWGTVVIGEGLIVVQVVLGGILFFTGNEQPRLIHYLYGALNALAWPATYAYAHDQDDRRQALIWTLVSVFLFGLSLRARSTGLSG